ncbi:hypothetical protein [Sphingomonas sp.]|uniref:hypothetical protein n=1 Tax=Sphingomonas sp. TaxID=28214 RepID=UPI002DD65145|nr:hypothetical protein [Sphingomonas sp.]
MIDLPPQPGYENTIEAIVQCGILRPGIRIKYEDELQSDEIRISDLGTPTDQKLRCLKAAVHPFYILTIENDAQRTAFYEFSERENRPQRKAEALAWLISKRLQDRVPSFRPEQGVGAFAVALEHACEIKPESALTVHGALIATRLDFVSNKNYNNLGDNLACLMNMFTASNANEHGVRFGFIGNEQFADEKK